MSPPNLEVRQGSPGWSVIGLERDVTLGIEKCQVTLEKDCQSTYHSLPLIQAERHNNSNSNNCLCFRSFLPRIILSPADPHNSPWEKSVYYPCFTGQGSSSTTHLETTKLPRVEAGFKPKSAREPSLFSALQHVFGHPTAAEILQTMNMWSIINTSEGHVS